MKTTDKENTDSDTGHILSRVAQRAWNGLRTAAPIAATLGVGVATSVLASRIEARLARR